MLIFVIISIFVAGLMVGRMLEYVGKKIELKEVKMATPAILVLPLMYLGFTAVATVLPSAVASIANNGHGFCRIPTSSRQARAITVRPLAASPATRCSTIRRALSRCSSVASS